MRGQDVALKRRDARPQGASSQSTRMDSSRLKFVFQNRYSVFKVYSEIKVLGKISSSSREIIYKSRHYVVPSTPSTVVGKFMGSAGLTCAVWLLLHV